jgi:hypothetical protein
MDLAQQREIAGWLERLHRCTADIQAVDATDSRGSGC